MKKLLFSAILLAGTLNAQVALSASTNNNLILDMKQGVPTGDKTFVLPQNATMAADKTKKTNVDTSTNTTLESGLLIYNTNAANNEKGPYFWYNYTATAGAWSAMVTNNNKSVLTNLNYLKNYSPSEVTDTKSATNPPAYWQNTLGDAITSNQWVILPAFTQPYTLNADKNIISFKLEGFTEAYFNGIANTKTIKNLFTVDIGIFIDGKLAVYSPFSVSGNKARDCMYNTYTLSGLLNNQSKGTHTVQVAVKNRNILNSSNDNVVVTYNTRNPSCQNSSSENKYLPNQAIQDGILTILIQENPSILNN